jgi:hypothetical protein
MTRSRGVTAAEVVMAALILAAGLVPMYSIFVKSSTTVTQSRFSYMALHAAREELEELRQIPFDQLPQAAHGFQPVTGHVFRRSLASRRGGGPSNSVRTHPDLQSYPADYGRILTKVDVTDLDPPGPDLDPQKHMKRVVLDVKWEETGSGSDRKKEAVSHFETIIAAHNVEK